MKLTTKIIIGIIGTIFILSLLFIIGFSFSERRFNKSDYVPREKRYIPQENQIGLSLAPHRVIVLEEDYTGTRFEDEKRPGSIRANMYLPFSLTVNLTNPEMENKLYMPEMLSGCIVTKMNNDTLTVQIKHYELRKKYDNKDSINFLSIYGADVCLHISNINIIDKTSSTVKISDITTDSILINSNGGVLLNSCNANVIMINAHGGVLLNSCNANVMMIDAHGDVLIEACTANVIDPVYGKLTVKNSFVKTIFLDLDRNKSWSLEECEIENQNVTASGQHTINWYRNEVGRINWRPKNKDAALFIKVPGDTTQIEINRLVN